MLKLTFKFVIIYYTIIINQLFYFPILLFKYTKFNFIMLKLTFKCVIIYYTIIVNKTFYTLLNIILFSYKHITVFCFSFVFQKQYSRWCSGSSWVVSEASF